MAATIKRKTVEGWETYPACLGSSTSFQVEWDFNRNRVSEAASNLFTQNAGNSAVQVLTPVGTATRIASIAILIADLCRTNYSCN